MPGPTRVEAVAFDLLMAIMNSPAVWAEAAGDNDRGLAWRDAVTVRMASAGRYMPYEELVADAEEDLGLRDGATARLFEGWPEMEPWADAEAVARLDLPYAFVTNCSSLLARIAADRSGLRPRFVLSAEDARWYKPHPAIYREACRRLGSQPATTVFVAGARYDAAGAQRAGLRSCLVLRRSGHAPDAGITVLGSLHELGGQVTSPARS